MSPAATLLQVAEVIAVSGIRRVEERTAGEIMTTAMIVGQATEPLAAAVERMAYHGLKELPLVDGEGRFVGFLSRRALLRAMAAGG